MPAPPLAAAANTSLVDALLEFLEAFIHQVLFVREIYSPELFERQRLYGIAVRRARHPELAAYIASAVAGLRVSCTHSVYYTKQGDSCGTGLFLLVLLGKGDDVAVRCCKALLAVIHMHTA